MSTSPLRFVQRHWLLLLLVAMAFVVRLYRIDNQPLDWHAWRQADTASVTREYIKHGIDLLHPQYHDVSNIPSGRDNLSGYRMVEFPILNAFVAFLVRDFGLPFMQTSRMTSIVLSLGTMVSLFYLVRSLSGKKMAYLTAFLFAFIPYSIFYSRVILPEPGMVFFSTFALVAFHFWLKDKNWAWYLLSFASYMVALLLKPSVVFVLPVYLGLIAFHELPVKKWTTKFVLGKILFYGVTLVPAFLIAVAPLLAWRKWIEQYPAGIPAFTWLLNSNHIRFRPAWFRWLFWERLTKLISGYFAVALLPLNILKIDKDLFVYGSWGVGIFAYLAVLATGNVQHDYYQVLTMPIVCIFMARGGVLLHDWLTQRFNKNVGVVVVGALVLGSLVMGWEFIKGYFNTNHTEYIVAGEAVDRLTPADALVIAPAMGDTQFLFQTNRRGWPIGYDIADKVAKGATFYITTSYDDEAKQVEAEYQVVEKNKDFILIDLTKRNPNATPSAAAKATPAATSTLKK